MKRPFYTHYYLSVKCKTRIVAAVGELIGSDQNGALTNGAALLTNGAAINQWCHNQPNSTAINQMA